MNNPNPLLPQGSLQNQKGKTNIRIAVFTILAIHVVLLGGLLMQGCKREDRVQNEPANTFTNLDLAAQDPTYYSPTNLPPESAVSVATTTITSAPAPTPSYALPEPPAASPIIPEPAPTVITPTLPAAGPATEYVVAKGDSFYKIAKTKGITWKAIAQANPTVDPSKLKVGQKLQIPAPGATPPMSMGGTAANLRMTESDAHTYVVRSGDTLNKIAKRHGTTARALRTENNLQTDQIRAGQKLKLPSNQSPTDKTEASAKQGRGAA
jgi:LysM repeat protein